MTEKMLQYVEEYLENDTHWKSIREKVQKAVDKSPTSVIFEIAEKQIKK